MKCDNCKWYFNYKGEKTFNLRYCKDCKYYNSKNTKDNFTKKNY